MTSRRVVSTTSRHLPLVALVAVTTVIPAVSLISRAMRADDLVRVWGRPGIGSAAWFSIWQGLASTAITLVVAAVPTWVLARYDFAGRRLAIAVLTVPFVLPTVVVASAFLSLLPSSIDRSITSVMLANVFFNISVVIRLVVPALSALPERQLEVARTLGAGRLRSIMSIAWPVVRGSVASAAALVFLMCSTSYGVVRLLAPPHTDTIETEIYRRAVRLGDLGGATALAVTQTVLIVIALGFSWSIRRRSRLITVKATRIDIAHRRAAFGSIAAVWTACALLAVPMFALILASVRSGGNWTTAGWRAIGRSSGSNLDVDLRGAITTSLSYAFVTAAVSTGVSMLANRRRTVELISSLPIAVSAVVVGFGLLVTYDHSPFDFRASWWLVPLVHASIAIPFASRAIAARRSTIPTDCFAAAATLGATPWQRFIHVELPLLRSTISTTLALSAAVSLGEFGATSLLTRSGRPTLPVVVARLLGKAGDIPYTAAMATASVLLVLTVALFVTLDRSVGVESVGA